MPHRQPPLPSEPVTIQPDPNNANQGTARGRGLLEASLREFGAGRAVLTDRDGLLIAGNKTFEVAQRLGIPTRVITTNGRELVVVQRRDLRLATDWRAKQLAIADNRVGELDLSWDPRVLDALRADGVSLDPWWTDEEFAALLDGADRQHPDLDRPVIEPPKTTIKPGDLFALDAHRLLCGDATHALDVATLLEKRVPLLMVTDPPYGVQYEPRWRHAANPGQRTAVGRVANDDRADWSAAFAQFPGDVLYAFYAGAQSAAAASAVETSGFVIRAQIVWRKQHFALSRWAYHHAHEPLFYAVRHGRGSHWRGDRTQTTVWDVPNLNPMGGTRAAENAPTGHSTQKPFRLFEVPCLNHTIPGDEVYDPFVGSGTAVMAAEKTGRTCLAMDIDPRYVQATIDRWEQFTGRRARRLGGSGRARREGRR